MSDELQETEAKRSAQIDFAANARLLGETFWREQANRHELSALTHKTFIRV